MIPSEFFERPAGFVTFFQRIYLKISLGLYGGFPYEIILGLLY